MAAFDDAPDDAGLEDELDEVLEESEGVEFVDFSLAEPESAELPSDEEAEDDDEPFLLDARLSVR